MATLTPSPKMQFLDANGNPLAGGKLYTYASGTTTPQATYTDATGGTPNTNPVILDSAGYASVWLGTALYTLKLTTSADVLVWTADAVGGVATLSALAASGGAALVGYTQGGTGAVATTVQAKLRESVSVKDFGAVGDGITDDAAAFNAALAASSVVIVPIGTYKIGSSVTIASGKALIGVDKAACILIGAFAGNILDVVNYATNIHVGNFTIQPGATATACIHTKGLNSSYLHDLYLGYTTTTTNVAHGLFIEGAAGGNGSYNNTCHNVIGQYLGGTGLYMKSTDGTNTAPRIGSWAFTGYHAYYFNTIGVEFDGTQAISFDNLTSELNATGMKFSLTSGSNVTNIAINIQQLYVGNNTSADYVSAANCLIYSNWFMFNGYATLTADLTAASKGNLFRQATNFNFTGTPTLEGYNSTGISTINRAAATNKVISLQVAAAEQAYIQADGKIIWGNDTNLYRVAANQLRTDDLFLAASGLGAGNTSVATSVSTVTRALPFYNASGALLGYIPIYQTFA